MEEKNSKIGILLLHGFSKTPDEINDLYEFLKSKGFNAQAPLIAGHGLTPKDLLNSTTEDWKNSVKEAYLKIRKESKKVFLVGNSFGSNLALWLAKEFKNEPAGIVTICAPIYLKYRWFIYLRLYTYGFIKKYYNKKNYSSKPTKSIRETLSFVRRETKPNLQKINTPILIIQATSDPLVHPQSALYIYNHIGSTVKKIYWFSSKVHVITDGRNKENLFGEIYKFIYERNNT